MFRTFRMDFSGELPEDPFDPAYAARLIERRIRLQQVTGEHAELALESLHGADDRPIVDALSRYWARNVRRP